VWVGDDRGARVRVDRDRGGPAAVDRLQRDADQGCGYGRERHLDHARRSRASIHGPRNRNRGHPAHDGEAVARGGGPRQRCAVRATAECARGGGGELSKADAVAAVLWVGATLYAVFGGADFGAGFWALIAGGEKRGERPRALIDWALGPVWEANHVWLIFVLVVLWTAFSPAFAAIMSTLFIPLSLAAFGIVLRGSGFALQEVTPRAQSP